MGRIVKIHAFQRAVFALLVALWLHGVDAWPMYNETAPVYNESAAVYNETASESIALPNVWQFWKALADAEDFVYNGCQFYCEEKKYRVAFVGSSISYYNDLPHVLGRLFEEAGYDYEERSVLRSGATLIKLWNRNWNLKGRSTRLCPFMMRMGPATVNDLFDEGPWDYMVMQDYSTAAAMEEWRPEITDKLLNGFLPQLIEGGTTPILFETFWQSGAPFWPGIRVGTKIFKELMDEKALQTWQMQALPLGQEPIPLIQTLIAPIGQAFEDIRRDFPDMFETLWADKKHPTPLGTLISAYILFWTITDGKIPPPKVQPPPWWFKTWREIRQTPNYPHVFPTEAETKQAWLIAQQTYFERRNYNLTGDGI